MTLKNLLKADNPILEYWHQIRDKKIVVCDKIYRLYRKLIRDLSDTNSNYIYDEDKANHAIDFIENFCKHSKGEYGGKPVILELWQKAAVAAIFGFVDKETGLRKYREVFFVVARKNGKSTLAAGIGLYLQIADGEAGSEVYAVATKYDQAKIVWTESKRMVNKSPALRKKIKTLVAELKSDWNDSFFRPVGSDSDSLDGLNVHGALLDEVHAWKTKDLYDVIVDGCSARKQPLIFIITTAGTIRESIFDIKYDEAVNVINGFDDKNGYHDDSFLPIIYELDNRNEWTKPKVWQKANPGLGTIKKFDTLELKVNRAKANPILVKNLVCKDFNIRETASEAWLTFEQLNNETTFSLENLKPRYAIGGFDLSSTTDLTSACIMFKVKGNDKLYFQHMYWLPESLLDIRVKEDKIPYDLWYERNLLRLTPGSKVHYKFVTDWFIEMLDTYDIYIPWIGYDSWSSIYPIEELKLRFGASALEQVIQGKKTLSAPMKLLGADLQEKRIIYNNNPITKWCLSNTAIEMDKNLNIQPCKTNNQRRRIDGFAAMLNAYVIYDRHQADYESLL